jgi:hypothetical protein
VRNLRQYEDNPVRSRLGVLPLRPVGPEAGPCEIPRLPVLICSGWTETRCTR